MRYINSEFRNIINSNHLKFRNSDEIDYLVEVTDEFYFDKFCLQTITFAKRLGSYLQHMIEHEGKQIWEVLDEAVYECDVEECVTSEHRRLAIRLLKKIWMYGDELAASTNSDGTTKKIN